MSAVRIILLSMVVVCYGSAACGQTQTRGRSVEAQSCFLRVRDKSDVPAMERGVLKQMLVEPGDSVETDQLLAVLDDVETRLSLDQARLDVAIAEKRHRESLAVEIAQAALDEAGGLLKQTQLEVDITRRIAESDISVRQARNDSLVSIAELDRALAARREFRSSISDQQLAKLTLARDQDLIRVEKAIHDQAIDLLRSRSKESIVEQQQVALSRLRHEVAEAVSLRAVTEMTLESLRRTATIAEERLIRRQLTAPLDGIVVEKLRHAGEWVEAGDTVFRVIRLDQLLVEGYVDATMVSQSARGNKVVVQCDRDGQVTSVEGRVVYVSPEIDPVSQQVQIRAEIPNPRLLLRPGQAARMTITPELAATASGAR